MILSSRLDSITNSLLASISCLTWNLDSVLILNGIYKDFFRNGIVNFDELRDSVNLTDATINYFQEELAWH